VNPKFSLLAETFDHMLGRLFNFAIVLFILLFTWTVGAMIIFGSHIPGFSQFGISLIECILMALGSGGRSRARARALSLSLRVRLSSSYPTPYSLPPTLYTLNTTPHIEPYTATCRSPPATLPTDHQKTLHSAPTICIHNVYTPCTLRPTSYTLHPTH
jgi:hypothetical protein